MLSLSVQATERRWEPRSLSDTSVDPLLEGGADPSARDAANKSAVHVASARGWAGVLRLLLAHSPAEVDAATAPGRGRGEGPEEDREGSFEADKFRGAAVPGGAPVPSPPLLCGAAG